MVHGTDYGIQYEIVLKEDIDFYDDLLPIWTLTRYNIEKKKSGEEIKLIIFTIYDFNKQLENTIFNDFLKYNYHFDFEIMVKHNLDQKYYLAYNTYLFAHHLSYFVILYIFVYILNIYFYNPYIK